jgi:DNA-binding CsgD family transcriptional regulator
MMKKIELDQLTQDQITQRHKNGETIKSISKSMGFSIPVITRYIPRTKITYTDEIKSEMARRYAAGQTKNQIASEMKVGRNAAKKYLPNPNTKLTQEQIEKAQAGHAEGKTKKQIAKDLGISQSPLRNHIPKSTPKFSQEMKLQARELVSSGKTKKEVAEFFGVSSPTIQAYTVGLGKAKAKAIPKKIRQEAINRCLAGEELSSVARDLNTKRLNVQKWVSQASKDFPVTQEQEDKIFELRDSGTTLSNIAAQLRIPIPVVNTTLKIKRSVRYTPETRDEAIKAKSSGENNQSIATRLGVSRSVVKIWHKEAIKQGIAKEAPKVKQKQLDTEFTWITREHPDHPDLKEWQQFASQWCRFKNMALGQIVPALTRFIKNYLVEQGLPKKPADLLVRGLVLPDYYATACPQTRAGTKYVNHMHAFIEWILDSPEFADNSNGEPIRNVDLFRNPLKLIPLSKDDEVQNESNKIILPYHIIDMLRKQIVQGPNFRDWIWTQNLSGKQNIRGKTHGGDWFEVNENLIDYSDPDCVSRERTLEASGKNVFEMWSPVRWIHALFHLQVPARGGQARAVDSGEADTFIYQDGEFKPNQSSLKLGTTRNPHQQGVFRRPSPYDESQGVRVALFFNTNKTQDKNVSGKSRGYICPFPPMQNLDEDPYYWLEKLRNWQTKYNPIRSLTRWVDLDGSAVISGSHNKLADGYPDTAFLFREAENSDHPDWPIGSNKVNRAWAQLLTAFETVLSEKGIFQPTGKPIQLINPENKLPWSSQHATRVSLITHLILDGDVPPTVMMKIAGHSRFIMTIYYTKVGLSGIQEAILDGARKLEKTKFSTFERDLSSASAEQMRRCAVFNAEDWKTVLAENPHDRTPLGWLHMHDRICLAGANTHGDPATPGCHNGGSLLKAASAGGGKGLYGPTPGSIRNCCRCRWSASGKQHIDGLGASYNNRSWRLHEIKSKAIEAERARNQLLRNKASTEDSGEPYRNTTELINAERQYEATMQEFQELALDIAALSRTIERVMQLPDNLSDDQTALTAQGDLLSVNMIVESSESKLLQLSQVCEDVFLYPDLNPSTAIFEYAQLLDMAFEREGQPLILARLSEKEKLAASNAIMRKLENSANPHNKLLGRKTVIEIMDRGSSLQQLLGINLNEVIVSSIPKAEQETPVLISNRLAEDIRHETNKP